jgi:hypothetical protein
MMTVPQLAAVLEHARDGALPGQQGGGAERDPASACCSSRNSLGCTRRNPDSLRVNFNVEPRQETHSKKPIYAAAVRACLDDNGYILSQK